MQTSIIRLQIQLIEMLKMSYLKQYWDKGLTQLLTMVQHAEIIQINKGQAFFCSFPLLKPLHSQKTKICSIRSRNPSYWSQDRDHRKHDVTSRLVEVAWGPGFSHQSVPVYVMNFSPTKFLYHCAMRYVMIPVRQRFLCSFPSGRLSPLGCSSFSKLPKDTSAGCKLHKTRHSSQTSVAGFSSN